MNIEHPYEFKLIRAQEITFNRLYQREIDKALIKHIFNNFDYHEVNPVKVTFHDSAYYAFDGQHTVVALQQKFGDNYLVPCLIYYDVPTWVEEAILFEKINSKKERRPVSTYALWKSKNNRGDETIVTIRKIVEKNGFILDGNKKGESVGRIRAYDALESIFNEYGAENFDETLNILQRSWHGNPNSIQSMWLRGMAAFVDIFNGDYRTERLYLQLSSKDPSKIKTEAKELKNQNVKTKNDIAFKVAQIYNATKGLGEPNKLDLSKVLK